MKIKVKEKQFSELKWINSYPHLKVKRQSSFLAALVRLVGKKDLKETHFSFNEDYVKGLNPNKPILILMNHSSFIDLEMIFAIFKKRKFHIVATDDGFVGLEFLMRHLGCIPTKKFLNDVNLVNDIFYTVNTLKEDVLMYPEASYSFDGSLTPLPIGVAKLIKKLAIPVVLVKTKGAYLRDPLYNNLQIRKIDVSANLETLFESEEIQKLSIEEIYQKLSQGFAYDHFEDQISSHIKIDEPFRADYLNRVLYKCPNCFNEGEMEGKGTTITCKACGESHILSEYGELIGNKPRFRTIPEWYRWERSCVKEELMNESYRLDEEVKIYALKDMKAIYKIGEGRLIHDRNGFQLVGCEGKLRYHQEPLESYSLYSDYYWYEIGDMICIGNQEVRYYCFPKRKKDIVAKARLAAEELYKLKRKELK